MKKSIGLLFAIFLTCSAVFAQSTVRGTVKDASSKETLPGASISLAQSNKGTVTDLDGVFKLTLKPGNIKLTISFVGYASKDLEVTVKEGENDLGEILLDATDIGLKEAIVTASFVRDRQTPVSVSTIQPITIEEKLGNQEFVEILKSTPSVYATKVGGGFGDSRISVRGFDNTNIGTLINGVPVNDMEGGTVYWSNWAGLSDITRTLQMQRGIGYSRLAISSIGGTMDVVTKTTDMEKGGSVQYTMGNDDYNKLALTLSTGLLENGWAVTFNGSHTAGNNYVPGTNYDAWSYFFNVSKKLSKNQQISLTVLGAPQWHNQRYYPHYIQDYRNSPLGNKLNTDYGYLNGQIYSTEYNVYNKPVASINHSWQIDQNTSLNTVLYGSWGRGGGRRVRGDSANWLSMNADGTPTGITKQTPDGYLDFASVLKANAASLNGSKAVIEQDNNSHNWYGIISSINKQIGNLNINAGVDGRFYNGLHTSVITDLLGGQYYLDKTTVNVNRPLGAGTPLHVNDIVNRDYSSYVTWAGLFAQAEYVKGDYSAFLSGGLSNTSYQRFEYFYLTPQQGQASSVINFLGGNLKGGFNYKLDKNSSLFVNSGYLQRAPFMQFVFNQSGIYSNIANPNIKPEKSFTVEGGYQFRSSYMTIDLTLYRTEWIDKASTSTSGTTTTNIIGVNQLDQGIEFEALVKPISKLSVKLMGSLGDWKWLNDATGYSYDNNGNFKGAQTIYGKGLRVGVGAQTTAGIVIDYEVLPKFKVGLDYNYYTRIFANYNITSVTLPSQEGVSAWQLPAYSLINMNLRYEFKIGKQDAILSTNVNNLLNTEYIADATDGINHDALTSYGYFGFGRTWTLSLKIRF